MTSSLLVNCAPVYIKNQRWYGDKGALGAHYKETQTAVEGDLSKSQWDVERFGMVCTDAKNFADTKAALEKLCYTYKNCQYIQNQDVQNFFTLIESISDESLQ